MKTDKMKCPYCGGSFIEKKVPMLFLDKYLEPETRVLECKACGERMLEQDEVERVYAKIKSPKSYSLIARVANSIRCVISGFRLAGGKIGIL